MGRKTQNTTQILKCRLRISKRSPIRLLSLVNEVTKRGSVSEKVFYSYFPKYGFGQDIFVSIVGKEKKLKSAFFGK